ncbi:Alpha-(1,3)-fucosyltransferase 4 [Holothuria leucospilota]|uniref:Fucosyltransferase n=1 Tax=Holothuria leucospilota TaxID=206669 RepID=A0A9Q1CFZ1_HOLLE|nr:Alpha-(1,3)-fucosyltransferase 4 [Holothuria leucospilota]
MMGKWFKYLATLSFSFNFMIVMFLTNNYEPINRTYREVSISRTSRFFSTTGSSYLPDLASSQVQECERSLVFYGMRQHWLTFCSYPEFEQYKHMIVFPRTVHCPDLNCSVVVNYTEIASDIAGYDIVVFTNVYDWMTPEMWDWAHGNRTKGQRWAMITEESPLYVPGVQPPKKYADVTFDWFDSYKSDSDFVNPYGSYRNFDSNDHPPEVDLNQFIVNKTHLIAWMGSHCETLQWDRMRFVTEFKRIVSMDTYGKCGDTEVPWNNDKIILDVLGKYKFYLSLENSCCEEYITEKFWRALEMGLVPVVVGAPFEHYKKYAPPNSFIHVDEFDSLTHLAMYLIQVSANDQTYLQYHQWRRMGKLKSYSQEEQYVRPLNNETQCGLLRKLLETDPSYQRKLEYFGERWFGSCRKCGKKDWINTYMHPEDYTRKNSDIWA